MRVIATAGHVDHGKSTLVHSLTGIDPDRLAEEKARSLTIDLGYAWLALPTGEPLGIIDVPGHRDFIENMLAGVGGIDAALLAVAADEGVMPQTREHLAILDLLGIDAGVVALTRVDLVDDPEWLELVQEEVLELLQGTGLAGAALIPVSATRGTGLDMLLGSLAEVLNQRPPRQDEGRPRLPVDRVFTMSGFGTVVTGTLAGGALHSGDEVELQPGRWRGRIRGLQSYQQKVSTALPGCRVAVNIGGLAKTDVARGHMLGKPGQLRTTALVDASVRYLASASHPLRHNAEVKFFCGTSEAVARVRLLDSDELAPGDSGWLQLRLADELPLSHGDRYILRRPSPAETIGGGVILHPLPRRHWKRGQARVLQRMRVLAEGSPAQRLALAAGGKSPKSKTTLLRDSGLKFQEFDSALAAALEQGMIVALPGPGWLARDDWEALEQQQRQLLADFHSAWPLRRGMPREALRSQLGIVAGTFNALTERDGQVAVEGDVVRLRRHEIRLSARQREQAEHLLELLRNAPYTPPSWSEAVAITGEELLGSLLESGEIVRVTPEVIFDRGAWRELVLAALQTIAREGSVTAGELRDRFGTSRKYSIALLESLDEARITRREGDARVRGPAPLPQELTSDQVRS